MQYFLLYSAFLLAQPGLNNPQTQMEESWDNKSENRQNSKWMFINILGRKSRNVRSQLSFQWLKSLSLNCSCLWNLLYVIVTAAVCVCVCSYWSSLLFYFCWVFFFFFKHIASHTLSNSLCYFQRWNSPHCVSLWLNKPVAVSVFLHHSCFHSPVIFIWIFTFSSGASELTHSL